MLIDDVNSRMLISTINGIAKDNPKMLDMILTDCVLTMVLKNIDKEMNEYLCLYLLHKEGAKTKNPYSQILMEGNAGELLKAYNLYVAYESIRKKRNLIVEMETDIVSVELALTEARLLKIPSSRRSGPSKIMRYKKVI